MKLLEINRFYISVSLISCMLLSCSVDTTLADPSPYSPTYKLQTQAEQSTTTSSSASKDTEQQRLINFEYTESTVLTVLRNIELQSGATIIPDESVKDSIVSGSLVNATVEAALNKVVGGYLWLKKKNGVYLVSAATPKDTFFIEFADVQPYHPRNQSAETISALLSPTFQGYVSIDKMSNLLLVTAPPQRMLDVMKVLQKIDTRARQYTVEALIAELNGGTSGDYGFSWNWHNFGVDSNLNLNYAKASTTDVATLKALIGQQKATLRANPRVSAFEGKETLLNVGTDTYITIQTGILTYQTAQVQIIKTGITLKVTGFLDDDGYVTLKIDSEVGDFTTPVSGYPTVTTRKVSTNMRIKSGETIVIGGLIQDTDTSVSTHVPLLGDLPLVGKLFQQKTKTRKRTDIVMMITPRITEQGAGQTGIAQNLPLPPDAPQPPPMKVNNKATNNRTVRIRCGNQDYVAADSRLWQSDRYFKGGHISPGSKEPVTNNADPGLYAFCRTGDKSFHYNIPLPNGKYELKLGFVEPVCTEVGQRVFDVTVNRALELSNFDPFVAAEGKDRLLIKTIPVVVTDGKLNIDFLADVGTPILSTIEVTPAP